MSPMLEGKSVKTMHRLTILSFESDVRTISRRYRPVYIQRYIDPEPWFADAISYGEVTIPKDLPQPQRF